VDARDILGQALKGVFDDAPDAICILRNGVVAMVNPACARLFGYDTPAQMGGFGLADMIAPEERERVCGFTVQRSRGEEAPQEYQTLGQRRDGTSFALDVHASVYRVDDEFAVLAVLRDVTQVRKLTADYAWFKTLFDLSPDPTWIIDQGRFIECNAAAVAMLGYADKEALRFRHPSEISPEYQPDGELSFIKAERILRLAEEKGVHRFEWNHRRADGSDFPAEVTLSRVMLQERPVLHCVWRDISERKQAEMDQRLAAASFESSDAVVITDADCVILRANQAFSKISGYSVEEVVGKKTNLLKSDRQDAAFYAGMWSRINGEGSWKGDVWNRRKNGEIFPVWLSITAVKGIAGAVTHYVGTFSDITQHKEAEERIRELAFYDPLTGLPNRRLLLDRLSQCLSVSIRNKRMGGLMFIDLDNFKTVNDILGHAEGDQLLRQVAHRITACIREGDTVARQGGDEFVVVLENLDDHAREAATQIKTVGEKILAAIDQPYTGSSQTYRSTASIGVTLFGDPRDNIDDLLKQADIAMYQAKAAGRNALRFFDPDLQAVLKARAALETDLRHGLQDNQFLLYYQPQADDVTGLTGVEALIRWWHPQRGLVPPAEFIPLAEETGLILPLGEWVLETACNQLVAWTDQAEMTHLTMAVNVSARQFRQANFVDTVLDVVRRTGADPRKLKLELTESMLVDNVEEIIAKMNALKSCGLMFSLDDFGTGYSSLSYLKRLPLSQIKIDQSFVRDVLSDQNDAVIARTIVALAHSMNLLVIAEGVENEGQRSFLADNGCGAFQGYLFSRPLTLANLESFARENFARALPARPPPSGS